MPIDYADYEALTVVELKDMADQMGVDIPHDARKSDIIDALRAAAPKEIPGGTQVVEPPPDQPESRNVYEYQMSSTETALCSQDDFWKIKLHS